MAARSSQSGTLTINTVTPITITDAYPAVLITNRTGSGTIWVRLDGTNPTVAGTDCLPVQGSRSFAIDGNSRPTTIKLIANAALDYTVEGGFQ